MSDCATPKIRFETATALPLASAFDGGRITSGRRFLWLAKVDLRPINQKLTKVLEVCLMAEIGFEDDKIRRAILDIGSGHRDPQAVLHGERRLGEGWGLAVCPTDLPV